MSTVCCSYRFEVALTFKPVPACWISCSVARGLCSFELSYCAYLILSIVSPRHLWMCPAFQLVRLISYPPSCRQYFNTLSFFQGTLRYEKEAKMDGIPQV
ncbi:hypothetical protein SCLCIDRAFT_869097 [Scleroderma citrinum Foug A]|uniref:Uncharacterized protein n=1 Tax=Scleroderma citrinum Foug A TaxID=1036808 RepID=A0A0C3E0J5_9AGAM|nr:hypothetical protein SCLCIDRAFT_869097 [Scleroderma citrinum Foug A]